jgi:hypothetical protein
VNPGSEQSGKRFPAVALGCTLLIHVLVLLISAGLGILVFAGTAGTSANGIGEFVLRWAGAAIFVGLLSWAVGLGVSAIARRSRARIKRRTAYVLGATGAEVVVLAALSIPGATTFGVFVLCFIALVLMAAGTLGALAFFESRGSTPPTAAS